jgi:pyruvate dehydrogenase E1 component alpha subunit
MAGEYVAGNDPDLIFEAAGRAVERARRGEGGTILELETERLHGHFIGDSGAYRPEEERKAMKDPIPSYRQRLLGEAAASAADITALEAKVQGQVDEAMKFGRDSDYPGATEALERLYA